MNAELVLNQVSPGEDFLKKVVTKEVSLDSGEVMTIFSDLEEAVLVVVATNGNHVPADSFGLPEWAQKVLGEYARKVAVVTFDPIGKGKSKGRLGDADPETRRNSWKAVLREVKNNNPRAKIIIRGASESGGDALVVASVCRELVDHVISITPETDPLSSTSLKLTRKKNPADLIKTLLATSEVVRKGILDLLITELNPDWVNKIKNISKGGTLEKLLKPILNPYFLKMLSDPENADYLISVVGPPGTEAAIDSEDYEKYLDLIKKGNGWKNEMHPKLLMKMLLNFPFIHALKIRDEVKILGIIQKDDDVTSPAVQKILFSLMKKVGKKCKFHEMEGGHFAPYGNEKLTKIEIDFITNILDAIRLEKNQKFVLLNDESKN